MTPEEKAEQIVNRMMDHDPNEDTMGWVHVGHAIAEAMREYAKVQVEAERGACLMLAVKKIYYDEEPHFQRGYNQAVTDIVQAIHERGRT